MINKMELSNKASLLRKNLGEDESSPIDIFKLAQTIDNLTLIFYPLGKNISGACYKCEKSNAIVINSNMSIGRQRFSLAHELYHLYFDNENMTVSMIQIGNGNENEKKADQFASYFLIPQSSLYAIIQKFKSKNNIDSLNLEDIVKIEQYYGVSHKAILYRLLDEEEIKESQLTEMESGIIGFAARLGYDTNLYYPSPEDKKMLVLGHYITMTEELLEKDCISQGKYEELLLDAFRDDIVFGIDEDDGDLID